MIIVFHSSGGRQTKKYIYASPYSQCDYRAIIRGSSHLEPHLIAVLLFYYFIFSSAFLRGLLPYVQTNDLAYVRHTSEGALTVRDLGPIYSDLWDPFATVELRLLSVRCHHLLIFLSYRAVYILYQLSYFDKGDCKLAKLMTLFYVVR